MILQRLFKWITWFQNESAEVILKFWESLLNYCIFPMSMKHHKLDFGEDFTAIIFAEVQG